MKTLIIAEIGNNHNGSIDRAISLVDAVKASGVKIAKFQFRNLHSVYRDHEIEDLGVEYTKDLLNKYNLTFEQHQVISDYCHSVGIEYMCTPWDDLSLSQLELLNVKRYKISSADFDNLPLIKKVSETGKPIYLSTGMNSFDEIENINGYLSKLGVKYVLLHCNSTYPAPFADIELNFIRKLKTIHSDIGYSGHERGVSVSLAAVALGATVIERHVTLDKNLEGPDHHASLLPSELETLSKMISEVEQALGDPNMSDKKLSQGALLNKENLGKSIVAARNLPAGTVVHEDHLEFYSPGQGMAPSRVHEILGKTLIQEVNKHDFIFPKHFTKQQAELKVQNLGRNWGVPVRPHDVKFFHEIFKAPVYEFHISYSDLNRFTLPPEITDLKEHQLLVHAPELFSDSRLLDLCAIDKNERALSIKNLQRVCNFCEYLADATGQQSKIKIIANVGGFSTHDFKDKSERPGLYEVISESLSKLHQPCSEIIPQNMAPFPWHFGGQRYQNIFMEPEEIRDFCEKYKIQICLDTAHLSMYCMFADRSFISCLDILLPYTAHLHMSDAQGTNGEGVRMGSGTVDFKSVLSRLDSEQSFIVETWQGHKNRGEGFIEELTYLDRLMVSS